MLLSAPCLYRWPAYCKVGLAHLWIPWLTWKMATKPMCIVYVCVCVKNKAQLHRAKVFTKKHSALLSMVQFHAGFNPEWKNCNPGCKFPPISAVGVVIMVLRCLHLLPQNPTPAPEISQIEPCCSVSNKQAKCTMQCQTTDLWGARDDRSLHSWSTRNTTASRGSSRLQLQHSWISTFVNTIKSPV